MAKKFTLKLSMSITHNSIGNLVVVGLQTRQYSVANDGNMQSSFIHSRYVMR